MPNKLTNEQLDAMDRARYVAYLKDALATAEQQLTEALELLERLRDVAGIEGWNIDGQRTIDDVDTFLAAHGAPQGAKK